LIKNERQLRLTGSQLDNFRQRLTDIEKIKEERKGSTLIEIEENAIKSQIKELEDQVREYELLWASKTPIPVLQSFESIPRALIKARISLGLNQKELAERVGLKEQQIQRYESTEYETASLARIRQFIKALDLTVSDSAQIPIRDITYRDFIGRMREIGFDNDFIVTRLLPLRITSKIQDRKAVMTVDSSGIQVVENIGKILRLSPSDMIGPEPLRLNLERIGNVRFKLRKGANRRLLNAYTFYAQYLALIVLQMAQHLPIKSLPTNPFEIHQKIIGTYSSFTLENAVRYLWSLGIPVMALDDPGAFQGAFFHERGRSIIIIKSKSKSNARWLFDLFHEFWHAAQYQGDSGPDSIVIEDFENSLDDEERDASLFSGAVILGRPSDELVQMCIKKANMKIPKLKQTVQEVAKLENVPIDVLANCVAYRIPKKYNWWGVAATLQKPGYDIPQVVRDILLEQVDLSQVTEFDLGLLRRALAFSNRTAELNI